MICEERLLYSNVFTVCYTGREPKGRYGEELCLGSWTSARKLLLQQAQRLVCVKTGITMLTEQQVSAAKESGWEPLNLSALLFLVLSLVLWLWAL